MTDVEVWGRLIKKWQVVPLGFLSDLLPSSGQVERGNCTWMGRGDRGQGGLAAQAWKYRPQSGHQFRSLGHQRVHFNLQPQGFPMVTLWPRIGLRPLFTHRPVSESPEPLSEPKEAQTPNLGGLQQQRSVSCSWQVSWGVLLPCHHPHHSRMQTEGASLEHGCETDRGKETSGGSCIGNAPA